ncbi:MAG TPA: GNAT family N-acetyltransferase [Chitinophagaceae bacterium]|nr:GNAT family N-acetyltransferase [Chitinophagaceae bacterium]
MNNITYRMATTGDLEGITQLFRTTVLQVNAGDYTAQQVQVWAERGKDRALWTGRVQDSFFLLAEDGTGLCGFGALTPAGYVDLLFIAPSHMGKGIGAALLGALEAEARVQGMEALEADVSITARPFFLRQGFRQVVEQEVWLQGVALTNFRMRKELSVPPGTPSFP